MVSTVSDLFVTHWPESAREWMPEGNVPHPGDLIPRKAYARTLRLLIETASGTTREDRIDSVRAEWKTGIVASALASAARTPHRHSTGADHAGVMTAEDIASFEASWETPVSTTFRGIDVVKQGPWGQGPALLIALALLDGFDDAQIDPSTADGAYRILEALKLALADRDAYFGDVDDPEALLSALLDPAHIERRRELIGETASLAPVAHAATPVTLTSLTAGET
ncbi:gamma-glutamyltranspeptidase [Microbacterium amylolyticum]|uniref:Gamma-glutamyltranspeptidase n=1 Tax=Microbacterium amylolyticum TaxID=936337 RepID=A0ABS4ZJI8_9MICO|nr:gamma-glutamyltranspeptidase [Microbacterium amylolyticum]